MARVITDIATMTAGYHQNIAPLQGLAPVGRVLYAKTRKGATVLVVPADHVLWSAKVADVAAWLQEPVQGQTKATGYQLWVLGDFSKKAQAELKGLGWELHPESRGRLFPDRK